MQYLGDKYLELHDFLGKLDKDTLLDLSGPPYYVQPLNPKEYALMFTDPIKSLRHPIKIIRVNKTIYKDEKQLAKYKKVLRDKGWTFKEDEEAPKDSQMFR